MGANATLNASDDLDGGLGEDTAKVTVETNFTGFTSGGMKNVEAVNLDNGVGLARNFAATGIEGVEAYNIDASNGTVNLTSLGETVAVNLSNQASGTFSTAFAAGAAELTGTDDAMMLGLTSVGADGAPVAITLEDIETITADTADSAYVSFAGTDLKTLNVKGAGATTITAVPTTLTGFDASEATGNVTADLMGTTSTLSMVKGGSGDDTIHVAQEDTTANMAMSGGDGADTLKFDSTTTNAVQYSLTGFETLYLNSVGAALTFSLANVSDLTTLVTGADVGAAVNLLGGSLVDLAVQSKGDTDNAGTVETSNTGAVTLDYNATAANIANKTANKPEADYTFSEAAGNLIVNVNQYVDTGDGSTGTNRSDVTANKASSVTLNVASGKDSSATPAEVTEFGSTITANQAIGIEVNADGKLGGTIAALTATGATVTNGSTAGGLTLNTPALQTLSVTSGATLGFTSAAGAPADSTLTGVQQLEATAQAGTMTFGALTEASTINLAGSGTASGNESEVTIASIGQTTNEFSTTLNASGLKGGLTVTSGMTSKTGFNLIANLEGMTGDANLGGLTSGNNATISASNFGGDLDTGGINAQGAVVIDAAAGGETIIGPITNANSANLTLDGSTGLVTLNAIEADSIDVDVSDTIGGAAYNGNFTAKNSAKLALSDFTATNAVTVAAAAGATSLTVDVTGGINAEQVTVTGNSTGGNAQTLTVKGNLGSGTDTLSVNGNAGNDTIDISGLSNYGTSSIAGGGGNDIITGGAGDDTLTTAALTALTFDGKGGNDKLVLANGGNTANLTLTAVESIDGGTWADVLTLVNQLTTAMTFDGKTGGDSITLADGGNSGVLTVSNDASVIGGTGIDHITTSSAAVVSIRGNAGNDVITLGSTGADTIVFEATAADNGNDAITGFTAGGGVGADVLDPDLFLGATAAAMNAVLTANPGSATDVEDDVNLLVDIAGGENITTAAGLQTALAAGGEYGNIDMAVSSKAIFVTAANEDPGTQYLFYANSDTNADIAVELVGTLASVDINDFVAADFNI